MKCRRCNQDMIEKTRTVPYFFGDRFVDVDEAWLECPTCTTTDSLRGQMVAPHPLAWKSMEQIDREEQQIEQKWMEKYGEIAPDES